jgi:hypothetical protein
VKSEGFRVFPHVLHFPSQVRNISLIGLKLIIFDIVAPQMPQTTSVKGYDITIILGVQRFSKTDRSKSIEYQVKSVR